MSKKKLVLIPYIEATDFPDDVEQECRDAEVSVHCDDDVFSIDWSDMDDMPLMQAWLMETYGVGVRKHEQFAVMAT